MSFWSTAERASRALGAAKRSAGLSSAVVRPTTARAARSACGAGRGGRKWRDVAELGPPAGFAIGHWTEPRAATGCTVVIPPPGTSCGVDVRGGGPGTRETDVIGPMAGAHEASGLVFSGGSALGLAAADGAAPGVEEQGRGHWTPGGVVPIVPAAVVY